MMKKDIKRELKDELQSIKDICDNWSSNRLDDEDAVLEITQAINDILWILLQAAQMKRGPL